MVMKVVVGRQMLQVRVTTVDHGVRLDFQDH